MEDRRARGRLRVAVATLGVAWVALAGCGILPDGAPDAASESVSVSGPGGGGSRDEGAGGTGMGDDGRSGGGRTAPPTPASGPTPATAPAPATPPTVWTATATAGPIVVEVAVPVGSDGGDADEASPLTVIPGEDGAQALAVRLGEEPVSLALTSDGSFVGNPDGSVTVLDDTGTAVGGLSPASPGARIRVVEPTRAEVSAIAGDGTASGTQEREVTTTLGATGLRTADWGHREGGRSLAVDPTAWARGAGTAGTETAWAELVAAEPEADSASMRDQFACHALGARDKATWNLEPWRPDVGLLAMALARCNPT